MNAEVQDYLIHAHTKVINHCQQLLRAESLAPSERNRIKSCLRQVEADLASCYGVRRSGVQRGG